MANIFFSSHQCMQEWSEALYVWTMFCACLTSDLHGYAKWLSDANIIRARQTCSFTGARTCAFESGINFFDTAEAYISGEAETIMGNVVQWGVQNDIWRRSDLVISTKVYWGKRDGAIQSVNDVGLSRKHIIEGITASLERLQLTYAFSYLSGLFLQCWLPQGRLLTFAGIFVLWLARNSYVSVCIR